MLLGVAVPLEPVPVEPRPDIELSLFILPVVPRPVVSLDILPWSVELMSRLEVWSAF
jgi:hypothetical protein